MKSFLGQGLMINRAYRNLDSYWAVHRDAKYAWWRFALILPVFVVLLMVLGALFNVAIYTVLPALVPGLEIDEYLFSQEPEMRAHWGLFSAQRISVWIAIGSLFLLLALLIPISWLAMRLCLGHKFGFLVSSFGKWRWPNAAKGFLVGLIVTMPAALILSLFGVYHEPSWPSWQGFSAEWLVLFIPALIVIGLQASGEEFALRAVLPKLVTRLIPMPIVVAVLTSAFFTALHWPNEDFQNAPKYIATMDFMVMTLFWCWVTLHTRGIEVACGLHTANNFVLMMFIEPEPTMALGLALWRLPPITSDGGGIWYNYPLLVLSLSAGVGAMIWLLFASKSPLKIRS